MHYVEVSGGDKRRPANLAIVDYRHSEVALIEIMIGGLMRRASRRRRKRIAGRKKGRPEIVERADVGEWLGVKQEAVPTKRTH